MASVGLTKPSIPRSASIVPRKPPLGSGVSDSCWLSSSSPPPPPPPPPPGLELWATDRYTAQKHTTLLCSKKDLPSYSPAGPEWGHYSCMKWSSNSEVRYLGLKFSVLYLHNDNSLLLFKSCYPYVRSRWPMFQSTAEQPPQPPLTKSSARTWMDRSRLLHPPQRFIVYTDLFHVWAPNHLKLPHKLTTNSLSGETSEWRSLQLLHSLNSLITIYKN